MHLMYKIQVAFATLLKSCEGGGAFFLYSFLLLITHCTLHLKLQM